MFRRKEKVNHSLSVQSFWDACVGMKKSCCLFVDFLLSLLICTGEYLFLLLLLLLTHGVIFILELQSPLNSGPSYCLTVLSSSEHAEFSPVWATWRKWSMEMRKKTAENWEPCCRPRLREERSYKERGVVWAEPSEYTRLWDKILVF